MREEMSFEERLEELNARGIKYKELKKVVLSKI